MLLPCLPSITAHDDQVHTLCEFVSGRGEGSDAHGNFTMRTNRKMARPSLFTYPGLHSPSNTGVLADRMTDTVSVIPDHMRCSIWRDRNPGSIVKAIFRQNFPRPRRACVLTDANRDAGDFSRFVVEAHRD